MKVAFLVNDLQLSGGVGVVVQHAVALSLLDDWDVTLVLVREGDEPSWHGYEHLAHLHVHDRSAALGEHFDIAIATWWETTFTLMEMDADRHVYFVQSLEDRFYPPEDAGRLGAALTLDLPVAFITEARWIADLLAAWRPDAPCHLVRNGIDKSVFSPPAQVEPSLDGPLRIIVEGSPASWLKRVPEAIEAVDAMREPHELTVVCGDREAHSQITAGRVLGPLSAREMAEVYGKHHVLVKLSAVEGMAGPPLEAFHAGATCVVTPVTGHEEYVEHGVNGLITDWDDPAGTGRLLDLLARDRRYLHHLRTNALETARAWPDWHQSSQFFAAALSAIAREPRADPRTAGARLSADLRSGLEEYQRRLEERARYRVQAVRLERITRRLRRVSPVALFLRARHSRPGQIAVRPLRPLKLAARRLMSS